MHTPSRKEIEAALYTDQSGNLIGLGEVQLLDDPPIERFDILQAALQSEDMEMRYRAAIVLAAWGDNQGLDTIEFLVDNRVDRYVCVPHRIYSYNNVYDELAYGVYLFGHCGRRVPDQKRIYAKLLILYGPFSFESNLKYALLVRDFRELIPDVQQACQRALSFEKPYLASQLLPVLAKGSSELVWQFVPVFLDLRIQTPNPVTNVAEALGHINSGEARA
jgi:hypothetical protein